MASFILRPRFLGWSTVVWLAVAVFLGANVILIEDDRTWFSWAGFLGATLSGLVCWRQWSILKQDENPTS